MPDPLLVTKVSLPRLRHILVPRSRVLRQLSEGVQDGHLLSLVSAPPGYGKTTTIRMWVEQAGNPVAWLTLEKSDNDLRQFLTYVLTALQQAEDGLGQAALEAVENTREINLPQIVALLMNDLRSLPRPLILVLEEYHLIENEKIDQAVELLLNQAVTNLHLVIATREDPNLPLNRLRVRNQLTEIRAADLSFSLEEAQAFLCNVMGVSLSDHETEILKNRTEGWAAGLQLAALSLRESADPARSVEAFRGTHRHVLDYLIEEVLNSQPEEIREFLRRTSILEQLSGPLCQAVTGQQDSARSLHYLESSNLFLVSLDEERTWYRYHGLFAELLKNQLVQAEPQLVDELYARAASWYQQNGFIQNAVEHAFQISERTRAAALIEKYALPLLYQGQVSTVLGWFDRLPETHKRRSPMMYMAKAWALVLMLRQTRTEEVEATLKAADEALNLVQADEALRNLVAGHSASIQAYLIRAPALASRNPEQLIETSQRAQQLLPENEKGIRCINALNLGHAYSALVDLPAAERAFRQAFEDGVAGGNFYAGIYGPISLIMIAMMKGQLHDALELCETNIDRFNRLLAGQNFPPIGALYILKGNILLEQDQLAEAEQALAHGLSLERWTGEFRAHMKGYSALARLRSIQGDWPGVLECIKSLEETRPEGAVYAQALRHRLSLRDPSVSKAGPEQAQDWVMQDAVRFKNLPDITGIDLVSEIFFGTHVSTAHILARLAARGSQANSLRDAHEYMARQGRFAEAHGLVGWLIEIRIARALMYQTEGKAEDAHRAIQPALSAAAARGYCRLFLDESDLMTPLLESLKARLKDVELSAFVKRLLGAMPGRAGKTEPRPAAEELLSEREIEVLRLLAEGETYKEMGQRLFLSLNTVQFHIKSIYRKLLVNKRGQAIEKARELGLI